MTICKFYLKGTCRFGDRCRFEHTDPDDYGGYGERYGNQYGQQVNYQQPNRYESRNYSEHYRAESPSRYSSHSNERQYANDGYSDHYDQYDTSRYNSGSYQSERYGNNRYYNENQKNYSTKNQYGQTNAQYVETYGQNKYKWSADDTKRQTGFSSQKDLRNDYTTSTPKGGKSFSFKLPESEIKKKSSDYELTQQDQLSSEIVKEDSNSWEHGGVWPFSSYFPIPNKPGFPGFSDISFEELRFAAYTAEKNNDFQSYVQAVQSVVNKVNQLRAHLKIPTPQLLDTMRKIWKGENLSSSSEFLVLIPYLQNETAKMESAPNAFPGRTTAATFSFKMPTETESSIKTSAAAFSFKTTMETDSPAKSKAVDFSFKQPSDIKTFTVSDGDKEIYTPLENLTVDEKEQFQASTFMLGKIPTKPPPQVYCM